MQKSNFRRVTAANPRTCIRCKLRPALGGGGARGKVCALCARKPDYKTRKQKGR